MKIKINRRVENECIIELISDWKGVIEKLSGKVVLFIDTNIKRLYGVPDVDGIVFRRGSQR